MHKETIISKGRYAHFQPEQMLSLKQYLFVREDSGKKQLLLRFSNDRNEVCNGFGFVLYRLDAKGKILGEERFESQNVQHRAGASFGFDQKIEVEEKCTDFRIKLLYASFGEYTYRVESAGVAVDYQASASGPVKLAAPGHRSARRIHTRTLRMPWVYAIVALIVLAISCVVIGYQLRKFIDNEDEFTLSGVKYAFVSADKNEGDVEIIGYSGIHTSVLIPSEIEGHRVVAIRDGAFSGNRRLEQVRIDGVSVSNGAFRDCTNLKEVQLVGVTDIGEYAFYNCTALTALEAQELESIGANAFYGCRSLTSIDISHEDEEQLLSVGMYAFAECTKLKEVSIDQMIVYPSSQSIFLNDTNIESLHLRNFAYTLSSAEKDSNHGGELYCLVSDAGKTVQLQKLKALSIDYIDAIVPAFCAGLPALERVSINCSEITCVGEGAFAGCTALSEFEVPTAIDTLKPMAFYSTALQKFDGSALIEIGDSAFEGCTKLSEITIPEDGELQSIGASAFAGCAALKTINIPAGVATLSRSMFKDCTALESITFGTGSALTEVAASMFEGCTALRALALPDSVHTIYARAFAGCSSLVQVTFPYALTAIGNEAFAESGLLTFSLPDRITNLGSGVLTGCESLSELNLYALPQNFVGSLFGASRSESLESISAKIPASLAKITLLTGSTVPEYGFAGCRGLKQVNLPAGVTSFGQYAFYGCSSLTSVPMDATLADIGAYAFGGMAWETVEVPDTVTSIGLGAFAGCSDLVSITLPFLGGSADASQKYFGYLFGASQASTGGVVPASLTTVTVREQITRLADYAFYDCTGLQTLYLPDGLTEIGSYAFQGCAALTAFDFSGITALGSYAFAATGLQSADLLNNAEITSLPFGVFADCAALREIVLPADLREIGDAAFINCTALAEIALSLPLESIGNQAFRGCTAMTSLELPASVSHLYSFAFADCTALSDISMRSGLRVIGSSAFLGCSALEQILLPNTLETVESSAFASTALSSITVPASVTFIGRGAFEDCTSLAEVTLPFVGGSTGSNTYLGYVFGVSANSQMPSTVKKVIISGANGVVVPANGFQYCQYVEEVILGEGVTQILDGAFAYCGRLYYLSLPSTLTYIYSSSHVFTGCYRLFEIDNFSSQIDVSSHYSGIGKSALEIRTAVGARSTVLTQGDFRFACYNGNWYLIDYPENATQLTLPATVSYQNTVLQWAIPGYLFYNKDSLTSVSLPFSVTAIGNNAFYDCGALTSIDMSRTAIASIGEYAFYYCYRLTEAAFGASLRTIGSYAFAYTGLQSIDFGNGTALQTIAANAFSECDALLRVDLPNSALSIGEKAFYGCDQLTCLTLSAQLQSIGNEAFYGCTKLYDVYDVGGFGAVAGSTANGYVARYAVVVHTALTDTLSYDVSFNGFVFRRWQEHWLLVNYTGSAAELTLGTLNYSGTSITSYRIAEKAFYGNNSLKKLTVSDAVKQIQKNAFESCYALREVYMSGSALTEIEAYTFSNCSKLRTVALPDGVKRIGERAFQSCILLESITMPDNLTSIGTRAFYQCSKLLSVVIPAKVTTIGDSAFYGCSELFEVYDLSTALTIIGGEPDVGYVAYYAAEVYTSKDDALQRKTVGNCSFVYAKDTWYLHTCDPDLTADFFTLPSIGSSYVILPRAFAGAAVRSMLVPSVVSNIRTNAFAGMTSSIQTVYYYSTSTKWSEIGGGNVSCNQTFYYGSCVHSANQWTYVNGDEISTERCTLTWSVKKEATCFAAGERIGRCTCTGCTYTETEPIAQLSHSFVDGACEHCGGIPVDAEAFAGYTESGVITNDATYAFVVDSTGKISSQNKYHSTSSTLIITAKQSMTVTFTYGVSSELGYDKFIITAKGDQIDSISGNSGTTYSACITLEAGESISFRYAKDGSQSVGDDCGYIRNLCFVM